MKVFTKSRGSSIAVALAILFLSGCQHQIDVKTSEPITINLNVKIEHTIKVKVDKELDALFSSDEDLF